eukprot:gene8004-biopygen10603
MVNYAWVGRSRRKLRWRSVAVLTCKSLVKAGYRGERPIEPSTARRSRAPKPAAKPAAAAMPPPPPPKRRREERSRVAAVVDDDDDSEPEFDAVLRAAQKDERGDEFIDADDFDEVSDDDSEGEAAAALLEQLRK